MDNHATPLLYLDLEDPTGVRATLRLSSVSSVRAISSRSGRDWNTIQWSKKLTKSYLTSVSATPSIAAFPSLRATPRRLARALTIILNNLVNVSV